MFPKSARLLKRGEFLRVQRSKGYLLGRSVAVNYRLGRGATARLGVTVSKKYGKAHLRNRFKRVVRALFRMALPELPAGLELEVRPRKRAGDMDEHEWKDELCKLFETAKSKAARSGDGDRGTRPGSGGGRKRQDVGADRPHCLSDR